MSDPEIFKSNTPHTVSIPEGASNALGIKAEVGEASIRKVLSDGSGETNEITTNDEELKGKKMPLSLDEEISLAREALQNKKDLRVEKDALESSDEFRAAKEGVKSEKDLRADKASVNLDEELKGAKEAFNASKDLRAAKAGVDSSGDLRAEKEGVQPANNLRVPKEGVNPEGDLIAPKAAVTANKDLRTPKENAKADTDLRAPKEGDSSNTAAALASSDPLVSIRPTTSAFESTATATSKEVASEGPATLSKDPQSAANTAANEKAEPDMDFPARVVHLKIENDNLRTALDKLESAP